MKNIPLTWFRSSILLTAFLISAVVMAYANIFDFAYLYDDEFLIQKNRFIDSFSYLKEIFLSSSTAGAGFVDSFYRPMQTLTYLLVQEIFGRERWAFHGLNLSLHIANTLLIFSLGRKLGMSVVAAFIGALLWALHPAHVEAVTYMSATADPLHVFFLLVALCMAAPQFSLRRMIVALLLFVGALLSKESAIVFPALLVSVIFLISQERWRLKTYLKTWPAWAVAGLYVILRATLLNFNRDFAFFKTATEYSENFLYRFQTFLATLPAYIELLVWPHDLHMDRSFPVYTGFWNLPVIVGLCLLLMALGLLIQAYRAKTAALVLPTWILIWFAAAHSPHSGLVIAVNSLFLEHWLYLPTIAFFLGLGDLLARGIDHRDYRLRWTTGVAVFAMALGLGTKTYRQNYVWESPISLFANTLKYHPLSARVRHNLAMALSEQGQVDEALEHYRFLMSARTTYHQTYHNAARIYLEKADYVTAEKLFLKAIELSPTFHPSYLALAELYSKTGETEKSHEYLKEYWELRGR